MVLVAYTMPRFRAYHTTHPFGVLDGNHTIALR
jgi:hypothetical protein